MTRPSMPPECRLEGPGQPTPSHTLPPGRFEVLPRIVQIAAADGLLFALEASGQLWWTRQPVGSFNGRWSRVEPLPSSSPVEP